MLCVVVNFVFMLSSVCLFVLLFEVLWFGYGIFPIPDNESFASTCV